MDYRFCNRSVPVNGSVTVLYQLTVLYRFSNGSVGFCVFREDMYYRAVHGTAVLFLQNQAGFTKWAPTPERLAELTAAYRPSLSRTSSLSSPGPAHSTTGERDSAPKASERTQSGVAPSDNNNGSGSSSGSPQDKLSAV